MPVKTTASPGAEGLRFIFVVGCQRSGTTLTGQILGAHPNAIFLDEIEGGQRWLDAVARDETDAEALFAEALAGATAKYRAPESRFLERGGMLRPAPQITHLAIKGLNSVYDPAFFRRFGEGIHIVFPVRDPRAVTASLMRIWRMPFVRRQTALAAARADPPLGWVETLARVADPATPHHVRRALLWRLKNTTLDEFCDAGFAPHAFRYEDLVDDPAAIVPAIAEAAGLSFDPAMLMHETVYKGRGPGGTARDRAIDAASLDKRDEWLTAAQQQDILAAAGPAASAFGYGEPEADETKVPPLQGRGWGGASQPLRDHRPFGEAPPPILLTGRGGSGTRILSSIARATGVFIGNRLNESEDSVEWLDPVYGHAAAATEREQDGIDGLPTALTGAWRRHAAGVLGRAGAPPDRWGWKLPETMLILPELIEAFPGLRLIHIVRHPIAMAFRRTHVTSRDMNAVGAAVLAAGYASPGIARPGEGEDREWLDNAVSWQWQVGRAARIGRETLGEARYRELRYEDFCRDPLAAARDIAAFLGAPLDETLLSGPSPAPPKEIDPADPRAARVWEICGETAALLGYTRDPLAAWRGA